MASSTRVGRWRGRAMLMRRRWRQLRHMPLWLGGSMLRYRAALARSAWHGDPQPLPPLEKRVSLPKRILQPPPRHLIVHSVVMVLAAVALFGAQIESAVPRSSVLPVRFSDPAVVVAAPELAPFLGESLAVPVLQSPDLSAQDLFAEYHTVAEGETLGGIAATYGISVASLFWANGLDPDRLLTVGQELRIPRRSGLLYIVQPNDTIAAIAARFQVPVAALTLFRPNHITHDRDLSTGQELFLPGATQPYPSEILQHFGGEPGIAAMQAIVAGSVHEDETNLRAGPGRAYTQVALLPAGTLLTPLARHAEWVQVSAGAIGVGWVRADLVALSERALQALPETNDFPPAPPRWVWPTYGELTSPFGWRTVPFRSFHNGIDIANRAGTPIVAARTGTVIEAGWCSGFGFCVKLNHGGGVTTIYGHMLRKPRVSAGESVAAGDLIGLMGSTFDRAGGGYSTGVHLHFTVKVAGKAVDPRKYLP